MDRRLGLGARVFTWVFAFAVLVAVLACLVAAPGAATQPPAVEPFPCAGSVSV